MLTLTLKWWYLLYIQFFILFFKVWPVYIVRVTHKSVLVWQTIALYSPHPRNMNPNEPFLLDVQLTIS